MLVAWVLFPLLLIFLCFGCGLLLEAASARRLPGVLLAPAGFALIVVLTGILTSRGETAALATPSVVVAAAVGVALAVVVGRRPLHSNRRFDRPDGWAMATAALVFLCFGAPVILSGHPTFLGYIKLDDTATWMAFVDRVMDHGRDLSGLEPSSYQTTLQVNLPAGYPLGAFLPLGVGAQLTATDVAWLVQPYMATMAALLALCLYSISEPLLESRLLRSLVAFGASQSALLFAYSLWGGIKEVAVALAIGLLAALAPGAVRARCGWRAVIPAAIAVTALLTMVGSGGLVWVVPILGFAALALWRQRGLRVLAGRALPLVLLVAVLGTPPLFAAGVFSPTQGGLTNAAELGNLFGPLSVFQFAGIWPNGDFRLDPVNEPLTVFLIALAIVAAITGAFLCWRRRAWEPLLYAAATALGSLMVFAYSSPWVGAKALASGSPPFLLLALSGAAAFAVRIDRALGATALGLILAGVLWSNALAYHDVSLAPYGQLRELESIGREFAGEGPSLMTEYQAYGVRHFLRAVDAEGASELRARQIPLREGGELEKGEWADTDQLSVPEIFTYRTLVLRRSPQQSRPPAAYSLVRRGTYYEVWQRPAAGSEPVVEHLPLGILEDPGAIPACSAVRKLAALAGPGGTVVAAERQAEVTASLAESIHPESWTPTEPGSPDLVPRAAGTAALTIDVPRRGRYGVYLLGSVRNRLDLAIDGKNVGSVEEQLNESRQYLYFGSVQLGAGHHEFALVLGGQTLGPGSGGFPEPIGPLVLDPVANEDPPLREVPSSQAEGLCGRKLDWIEALSQSMHG